MDYSATGVIFIARCPPCQHFFKKNPKTTWEGALKHALGCMGVLLWHPVKKPYQQRLIKNM